jgi:transcriptional regulator with XRE-family HTH domain
MLVSYELVLADMSDFMPRKMNTRAMAAMERPSSAARRTNSARSSGINAMLIRRTLSTPCGARLRGAAIDVCAVFIFNLIQSEDVRIMGTNLPIVKEFMSNYLHIGVRLREERERLGINQTDFAALGGSGRKTQFNYEAGERVPDAAYLAAIAAAGADVLYILTGQHSSVREINLSPDEEALLDNYRAIPDHRKFSLNDVASALAAMHGDKKVAG